MQDLEVVDPLDAVFASVASLTTADVTPKADRSKHIEIYDSSATCHMSPYIKAFANFEFIMPKPISTANNQTFEAIGKGTLCVKVPNGDAFTVLTLNDIFYAPNIAFTLVSLSRADKAGCQGYSLVLTGH